MIAPKTHTAFSFSYPRRCIHLTSSNHGSISYCICHLSFVIIVSIWTLISPSGKESELWRPFSGAITEHLNCTVLIKHRLRICCIFMRGMPGFILLLLLHLLHTPKGHLLYIDFIRPCVAVLSFGNCFV